MNTAPGPQSTRSAPVFGSIEHLFALVDAAGKHGVSDIHVVPDKGVWFLTQGVLSKDTSPNCMFHEEHILGWLDTAASTDKKNFEPLGDRGHTSVSFDTRSWRVRASFRRTTEGVSVTFRLIPSKIPDADTIGVPKDIQDLMDLNAGLIIIEGPTGSGKTTSIASLIGKVNKEKDLHIYTIEDPIEFIHEPIGNTMLTQREIGLHSSDFPSAVENALRSKPNVIVVGELLNPATAKAALHAATTGHLVVTTAHAGSVTEAIDSFIGQFTAEEQPQIRSRLSQSLLAIMVQKLVPGVNGGLVAAREIMINDLNFADIIKDESRSNMIHQALSAPGCISLEQSLCNLVVEGLITAKVALENSRKPDDLRDLLERKGIL